VWGVGLHSALGTDAVTSLLAWRLGHSEFNEHPCWVDQYGEPMVLAAVPGLDPLLPADQRLLQLGLPSALAALERLDREVLRGSGYRLSLFLGLPEWRTEALHRFLGQFAQALTDSPWPIREVIPFPSDRNAGLTALQQGADYLQQSVEPLCLVGALDSWIDSERLTRLDALDLLHSTHCPRGFVPGEGAAFCLLARDPTAGLQAIPYLRGIAHAKEDFRPYTQDTPTGNALSQACRQALAALPQHRQLKDIYADFNGERWRATEYGFASLRLAPWLERTDRFHEIAGGFGDTGVAAAMIMLILALTAAHKGYAAGDQALIWSAGAGGGRAAALIRTPLRLARLRDQD